jgi:hypothetical protein
MRFTRYAGAVLVLAVVARGADAQGFGRRGGGARVAVGPRGGVAATTYRGGAAVGPFGGVHAGGVRTGTYVAPGGAVYHGARAGGVAVGPYGGVRAAGVGGARVGAPYAGVRYGAVGGAAVRTPYGAFGAGYRPGGYAVGHYTRYWSPSYLEVRGAYIRRGWVSPIFTPAWYRLHPVAWAPRRWRVPNYWIAPTWLAVADFCSVPGPPIAYDYGGTTVIDNNAVYVNGEEIATADQYASQATSLADAGRQANPGPDDDWQPLGVFGLVEGDEEQPQHIFQLAINRAGVIRGNYYDALVDNTVPVYGSLDPKTQRVAWSAGDRKTVVFETGLNNLTQEQTTVLVHHGNERTVEMALVRLNEPAPG